MATNYDLDWDNVPEQGSGTGAEYMKLANGPNRIRIVGKLALIDFHWENSIDGKAKKIVCSGSGCPICKAGKAPMSRYLVKVIDRADGKVKLLEGGSTIFNYIKTFAKDKDFGNPENYDIKITREGAGRDTKYTVIASPKHIPLTDDEVEMVKNSKSIAELIKPKTNEEIYALQLKILSDSSPEGGNDKASAADDWDDIG